MGFLILIVVEVAFAAIALAMRLRIVWPIAVTMVFASIFGHLVYDRPLPRLW